MVGANYDESTERGWWLGERRGEFFFEGMETVVFPAELEEGDALAAWGATAANGDGFPAPPPSLFWCNGTLASTVQICRAGDDNNMIA